MDSQLYSSKKFVPGLDLNKTSKRDLNEHVRNLEQENEPSEGERKVKTKLMSMWNNMKYGWTAKTRTNFSKNSPVWLLGKCYHKKIESSGGYLEATSHEEPGNVEEEGIEGFKADFISRVWLTYRREFPILNGSSFTTDCGWGCMLRSGQMLLAQALLCHFLGRDWRWMQQNVSSAQLFNEERVHRMIIRWFGDNPSCNNPLSLHTLVSLGESTGKKAGDWYGPGSVAHLLRQAVEVATKRNPEFEQLSVYVAQDCTVYIDDVVDQCAHEGRIHIDGVPGAHRRTVDAAQKVDNHWKALILLIPVRLGVEKINMIYTPCLTALLTLENCIGIIGGRPKHSLYFVGFQDDKLIHLDPHYCQQVVDVWAPEFPLDSFHCRSPRKMSVSRLDPSCCIGFYLSTREDFHKFISNVKPSLSPTSEKSDCPMFVFYEGRSRDVQNMPRYSGIPEETGYTCGSTSYFHDTDDELECEEFEIL